MGSYRDNRPCGKRYLLRAKSAGDDDELELEDVLTVLGINAGFGVDICYLLPMLKHRNVNILLFVD